MVNVVVDADAVDQEEEVEKEVVVDQEEYLVDVVLVVELLLKLTENFLIEKFFSSLLNCRLIIKQVWALSIILNLVLFFLKDETDWFNISFVILQKILLIFKMFLINY